VIFQTVIAHEIILAKKCFPPPLRLHDLDGIRRESQ